MQVREVTRAIRAVDAGSCHAGVDDEDIVAAQSVLDHAVFGKGSDDVELFAIVASIDNSNCHFDPICALIRLNVNIY